VKPNNSLLSTFESGMRGVIPPLPHSSDPAASDSCVRVSERTILCGGLLVATFTCFCCLHVMADAGS
jgi:hypothetical protein